jgi:hypothetical protein
VWGHVRESDSLLPVGSGDFAERIEFAQRFNLVILAELDFHSGGIGRVNQRQIGFSLEYFPAGTTSPEDMLPAFSIFTLAMNFWSGAISDNDSARLLLTSTAAGINSVVERIARSRQPTARRPVRV